MADIGLLVAEGGGGGFEEPVRSESANMIDAAEYFHGQRLSEVELSRIIADIGSPSICVSLITGRCGSTHLAEIVKNYGRFGTGHDAFHALPTGTWQEGNPARDLAKFIQGTLGRRALAGGVAYLQISPARFERLMTLLPESFFEIASFSSITRRNILAQAISYAFAIATDFWHDYGDAEYDKNFVPDDVITTISQHIKCILEGEKYISQFQDEHPNVMGGNIFYEDIVADPLTAISTLIIMHGHVPDIHRLAEAFARHSGTRKITYLAFPDIYREALIKIPGLAELVVGRLSRKRGAHSWVSRYPMGTER